MTKCEQCGQEIVTDEEEGNEQCAAHGHHLVTVLRPEFEAEAEQRAKAEDRDYHNDNPGPC
jgi:hypothetical protein